MKQLITFVFALSFCFAFGQDSVRKIDIPVLETPKPNAIICPPISKVEILPMPPRCQSRYSKLREMGENAKAREFGADCLKDYFTNLLGDYIINNQKHIEEILINNCAHSAKGRLKIVIDENGVMSKVEIYGNPRTNVDKQFTQKTEQGMKQIAAQLRDRGELFSQAKTSDGEVVRMYYLIPINFNPEINYRNHPVPKDKELKNKKKLDEYLTDLFADLIHDELKEKLDEEQIKTLKKAKPVVQVSYKINQDGDFEKLEYSLKVDGKAFSTFDKELGNKELSSSDLPEFYPAYENESCESPRSFEDKLEIDINKIL